MAEIIASKSNLVAIGAWNSAIIQADWLATEFPEITPKPLDIEVEIETNNIRFDFKEFYLSLSNNRLSFIPKNEVNDNSLLKISELAKGIFNKLNFTPIAAVGTNFYFQLSKDEVFASEEIEREPFIDNMPNKMADAALVSRSITHTFSKELFNVNVIYSITGKDRGLLINFDYRGAKGIMDLAASSFSENLKCALELSERLIVTEEG